MLTLEKLRIAQEGFLLTAEITVKAGARVAVMGPSGAGKSTLLAVISGFFAPASGRVLWQGKDLTALPPAARPVSSIFQDNNLFPHLTIQQNVALGIRPSGTLSSAEQNTVQDSLARVGLEGFEARKPATLSGGQQSRAALARMLVQAHPIAVLDEPFSALGPAMRADMIALVRALCDDMGTTLLMVTHDPEDARRLDGDLALVAEGRVTQPARVHDLLDNPPPELRAYLGSHHI